jgi:hypothetical protein
LWAAASGKAAGSGEQGRRDKGEAGTMAEVMSDFHGELNDVLSKVNSWALGREKDLLSLQAEHTSFLDTHNGAQRGRRPPQPGGSGRLRLPPCWPPRMLSRVCPAQERRRARAEDAEDADARALQMAAHAAACARVTVARVLRACRYDPAAEAA